MHRPSLHHHGPRRAVRTFAAAGVLAATVGLTACGSDASSAAADVTEAAQPALRTVDATFGSESRSS